MQNAVVVYFTRRRNGIAKSLKQAREGGMLLTQYRYNRALGRLGLDNNMQGLIYYKLMNIKRSHKEFDSYVKKICREVAGEEWKSLYIFLTDGSVNEKFIYNKYRIPVKCLYFRKRQIYVKIAEKIRDGEF